MKHFLLILIIFLAQNCSKPKTVLICGDHVCINKSEANQYFEENLSLEVKIINKKDKKEIDLVELNLNNDTEFKKKISIKSKKTTNENIKILTNDEILKIKKEIKQKKKNKNSKDTKKFAKKNIEKNEQLFNKDNNSIIRKKQSKNASKRRKEVVDVCTVIEKCSIDEISKYLLKEGRKKGFPDITTRE